MSDEIKNKIIEIANGDKRLQSGSQSQESHSLKELMDLRQQLLNEEAVTGHSRKICINKLRPPGSI